MLVFEQVFDVPMTEIEPVVEPNGIGNYVRRESVAFVCIHPAILPNSVP